jgi:polar amino acid transport system substrate-binding protein
LSRLSVLAAVCAAGVLAGCGATTEPPTEGKGTSGECTPGDIAEAEPPRPIVVDIPVDDALAKMVPASVKADGKLVVAKVAGDVVGMDVDLGNAVGQVLGLEVQFVDASLDGILAGRYELGMSSLVATDEQAVDFVTYFEGGTSTMVRKCNPEGIETAGPTSTPPCRPS